MTDGTLHHSRGSTFHTSVSDLPTGTLDDPSTRHRSSPPCLLTREVPGTKSQNYRRVVLTRPLPRNRGTFQPPDSGPSCLSWSPSQSSSVGTEEQDSDPKVRRTLTDRYVPTSRDDVGGVTHPPLSTVVPKSTLGH